MSKLIKMCPACGGKMRIASIKCGECGLEIRNEFEQNPFLNLDNELEAFLLSFIKNRGNLTNLQNELNISYPAAKKLLDKLLIELGLETDYFNEVSTVNPDITKDERHSASAIIRNKLYENGSTVILSSARGLPIRIKADADGKSFECDKLPLAKGYEYTVFDILAGFLLNCKGYQAPKGNGRNYKVGQPNCDRNTCVGVFAYDYCGKKDGESTFDPIFVFAAIMEWAGIAINGRGYIQLTSSFVDIVKG
ncbi:MAG: DUF2089 family protein [Oscillospiraceae bacterium]|nr:DUF2089 family protein [Oscillospiraceae bacterium]